MALDNYFFWYIICIGHFSIHILPSDFLSCDYDEDRFSREGKMKRGKEEQTGSGGLEPGSGEINQSLSSNHREMCNDSLIKITQVLSNQPPDPRMIE